MTHASYSDDYIADILGSARTFAFVGVSANTSRPSYFAMKYLLGKGYKIIPVNPGMAGQEILGQKVYASLTDLPTSVDVVDIFRASDAALGIVREAISLKDKLRLTTIWMQLGVVHEQAADRREGKLGHARSRQESATCGQHGARCCQPRCARGLPP